MIARFSPSRHDITLYSGQMYHTIHAYAESGDFVRCQNCNKQLLLKMGTEICPVFDVLPRFKPMGFCSRQS